MLVAQRSDSFPHDQAVGLRRAFARRALRVFPVCSLARDTICQTLLIQLAAAFAERGQRVALLDGDRGMLSAALGLRARYELLHLMTGERDFAEVALAAESHLMVMPAARGLEAFIESGEAPATLFRGFLELQEPFDTLLVSGPPATAAALAEAREEVIFVTSQENDSLTYTYASIKRLATDFPGRIVRVIVAGVSGEDEGQAIFERIAACGARFLRQSILYGGALPDHADLREAAAAHKTVFRHAPRGEAAQHLHRLADASESWSLSCIESSSKV